MSLPAVEKLIVKPTNSALFSALQVEPRTAGRTTELGYQWDVSRRWKTHFTSQMWKGSQGDYCVILYDGSPKIQINIPLQRREPHATHQGQKSSQRF
jgi:hypothetical protein